MAAVESNKWSAGEITIIGCADNINSTASHFGALCLVTIFMTLSKNIFSHGGNRSVCCGRFEDLGTGCQGEAGSEHARSGDGLVIGPHSRFWQVVVYCLRILMVLVIFKLDYQVSSHPSGGNRFLSLSSSPLRCPLSLSLPLSPLTPLSLSLFLPPSLPPSLSHDRMRPEDPLVGRVHRDPSWGPGRQCPFSEPQDPVEMATASSLQEVRPSSQVPRRSH